MCVFELHAKRWGSRFRFHKSRHWRGWAPLKLRLALKYHPGCAGMQSRAAVSHWCTRFTRPLTPAPPRSPPARA